MDGVRKGGTRKPAATKDGAALSPEERKARWDAMTPAERKAAIDAMTPEQKARLRERRARRDADGKAAQ